MSDADPFCFAGRALPSLFIIGAQKCATTSMARLLFAPPFNYTLGTRFYDGLGYSDTKEHHFLDRTKRYQRGLAHYASTFPRCGRTVRTLDATPDYLHTHGAAARLAALYGPERIRRTTFVASLCEPVHRAQSAHYHFRGYLLVPPYFSTPTRKHIRTPWLTFRQLAHRDVAAEDLDGAMWTWGRYSAQLEEWANATARVHVIPLPLYSHHEQATLHELACLDAARRSGSELAASSCAQAHLREPPPGPHIGSHPHPKLDADINRDDALAVAQSFAASNRRVYELLAHDTRFPTVPSGLSASEYGKRFLDLVLSEDDERPGTAWSWVLDRPSPAVAWLPYMPYNATRVEQASELLMALGVGATALLVGSRLVACASRNRRPTSTLLV